MGKTVRIYECGQYKIVELGQLDARVEGFVREAMPWGITRAGIALRMPLSGRGVDGCIRRLRDAAKIVFSRKHGAWVLP